MLKVELKGAVEKRVERCFVRGCQLVATEWRACPIHAAAVRGQTARATRRLASTASPVGVPINEVLRLRRAMVRDIVGFVRHCPRN